MGHPCFVGCGEIYKDVLENRYGVIAVKKMRNAISSRMHRLSARELYFGACFATVNFFAKHVQIRTWVPQPLMLAVLCVGGIGISKQGEVHVFNNPILSGCLPRGPEYLWNVHIFNNPSFLEIPCNQILGVFMPTPRQHILIHTTRGPPPKAAAPL